ncbi:HrpE/YscL family type III secretion apparatus protein [Simkania negevensis]|uniref:Flagellar assembly protein FliH n=1 Tax=Simkania negevensis TaxID=83561 RepID=A0ABS3AR45_9BACT|nr:HrpE/YscL family type III secretion apparatus protein [Simkania negevensis]
MKLFSLIKGDKLHISRGQTIIPAKEAETLLDAKETLDRIIEEAEQYRQEVAIECEKIKEAAEREGFDEGLKRWTEQLFSLEQEAHIIKKEMEKIVVPLVITAAKKVVGRELKINPDIFIDILSQALKAVSQNKRIILYVNKKELDLVDKNKPRLRQLFDYVESFSVQSKDDVEPQQCIIETEGGIIYVELEKQWKALETVFRTMLKEEKEPPGDEEE